jgi:endoglucanase
VPLSRPSLRQLAVLSILSVLNVASAAAQAKAPPSTASEDPAFARATHLRHGINASMWFAQADDYSPQRLRSFTTADDIALMHRLGFDHVRVSVDAEELMREHGPAGLNDSFITELDAAVKTMLAQGLAVIVDVHPSGAYKQRLRGDPTAAPEFASLWSALAKHYAATDPERVFFEVLNEPEFTDMQRWVEVEEGAVTAIRAQAPQHTIIATSVEWSGLGDLLALQPLRERNIIYTFHDYEPFAFTHQGATWAGEKMVPLHGVPYPSTPEAVSPLLGQEVSLTDQFWLNSYGLSYWNAARIQSELAFAARWSGLHHVPVYCGEFGVYEKAAPPAMRAAWLHDVRTALEANGIGWAMWDYQGGFRVVDKTNGRAIPVPSVVEALGLHAR